MPPDFTAIGNLSALLKDQLALGVVVYDDHHRLQFGDNLWAGT